MNNVRAKNKLCFNFKKLEQLIKFLEDNEVNKNNKKIIVNFSEKSLREKILCALVDLKKQVNKRVKLSSHQKFQISEILLKIFSVLKDSDILLSSATLIACLAIDARFRTTLVNQGIVSVLCKVFSHFPSFKFRKRCLWAFINLLTNVSELKMILESDCFEIAVRCFLESVMCSSNLFLENENITSGHSKVIGAQDKLEECTNAFVHKKDIEENKDSPLVNYRVIALEFFLHCFKLKPDRELLYFMLKQGLLKTTLLVFITCSEKELQLPEVSCLKLLTLMMRFIQVEANREQRKAISSCERAKLVYCSFFATQLEKDFVENALYQRYKAILQLKLTLFIEQSSDQQKSLQYCLFSLYSWVSFSFPARNNFIEFIPFVVSVLKSTRSEFLTTLLCCLLSKLCEGSGGRFNLKTSQGVPFLVTELQRQIRTGGEINEREHHIIEGFFGNIVCSLLNNLSCLARDNAVARSLFIKQEEIKLETVNGYVSSNISISELLKIYKNGLDSSIGILQLLYSVCLRDDEVVFFITSRDDLLDCLKEMRSLLDYREQYFTNSLDKIALRKDLFYKFVKTLVTSDSIWQLLDNGLFHFIFTYKAPWQNELLESLFRKVSSAGLGRLKSLITYSKKNFKEDQFSLERKGSNSYDSEPLNLSPQRQGQDTDFIVERVMPRQKNSALTFLEMLGLFIAGLAHANYNDYEFMKLVFTHACLILINGSSRIDGEKQLQQTIFLAGCVEYYYKNQKSIPNRFIESESRTCRKKGSLFERSRKTTEETLSLYNVVQTLMVANITCVGDLKHRCLHLLFSNMISVVKILASNNKLRDKQRHHAVESCVKFLLKIQEVKR